MPNKHAHAAGSSSLPSQLVDCFHQAAKLPKPAAEPPPSSSRREKREGAARARAIAESLLATHIAAVHTTSTHDRARGWSDKHRVASGDGHCQPRPISFVMRTSHPHITPPPPPPRLTTPAPAPHRGRSTNPSPLFPAPAFILLASPKRRAWSDATRLGSPR